MDLLQAYVKAAVPDSKLIFAGEGPRRAELEAEAARGGCTSRAVPRTCQSIVTPRLYKIVDLPSSYEAFAVSGERSDVLWLSGHGERPRRRRREI